MNQERGKKKLNDLNPAIESDSKTVASNSKENKPIIKKKWSTRVSLGLL